MSGRRAFLLLMPLLLAALAAQAQRARDLLRAGRVLHAIAATSGGAAAAGGRGVALLRANLALLRAAGPLAPADVRVPMSRGSLHLLLGNPHEAIAAYREALRLEPRPEVYLNLGRAQAAAGDREAARASFALAVRLAPELAPLVPKLSAGDRPG